MFHFSTLVPHSLVSSVIYTKIFKSFGKLGIILIEAHVAHVLCIHFFKGIQTFHPNKMTYQLAFFPLRLPENCYQI